MMRKVLLLLVVLCASAVMADEVLATTTASELMGSHRATCPVQATQMKPSGNCGCPKGGGNCCVKRDGSMGHCQYDGGVCCPLSDVCCPANTQCTPTGQCVAAAQTSPQQVSQAVQQMLKAELAKPAAQHALSVLGPAKAMQNLVSAAQHGAQVAQQTGQPMLATIKEYIQQALQADVTASQALDSRYKHLNGKFAVQNQRITKRLIRRVSNRLRRKMAHLHGVNHAHVHYDNHGRRVPRSVRKRASRELREATRRTIAKVSGVLNKFRAKSGLKAQHFGRAINNVRKGTRRVRNKIRHAVHRQKKALKRRLDRVRRKMSSKCRYKRRGSGCFKCCPLAKRCRNVGGRLKCSVRRSCKPAASSKCGGKKRRRCFAPATFVNMAHGPAKRIDELRLGDVTSGGAVTGVMHFVADGAEVFNYKGVVVSGEHKVLENGEFVAVGESKAALAVKDDLPDMLYDVNTETHRVFVRDLTFADYAETHYMPVVEALELSTLNNEQ